jgi:hypothetical protein
LKQLTLAHIKNSGDEKSRNNKEHTYAIFAVALKMISTQQNKDGGMDKVGIGLSDMVWSLDKNTQEPQKRKSLEAGLQSLTPGQHTLYIVSPEDQIKAHIDENASHSGFFNPKRRKVSLPQ